MENFIFGCVITTLLSLCVYFYIQNTSLSAVITTYKNNQPIVDKDFQKAKESYFIQQQGDNTSLVLFTVTALFTIFSFFTFNSVKRMFDLKVSEIEDNYNANISKYHESVVHINNLRSGLSLQFADKIYNDFSKVLLEKPLDISTLIELGLSSCLHYCLTISHSSYNTEEISLVFSKNITSTLDVMVNKVKTLETVKLDNFSYARFLTIKSSVDNVLDEDNLKKFSIIFSKLSFSTLD